MMASPNDTANVASSSSIDASGKEVIKSQFITREGTYKLMTLSEYSRPSRVPLNPAQGNNVAGSAPVHVSFVTLPADVNESSSTDSTNNCREKICFNVGRELYVYNYEGVAKAADLSRPIDKRVYKGTYPTCHDFNQSSNSVDLCELLVGFSAGQIQLINPFKKEAQVNRLFNEDRTIDKSRVTCLKWIPGAKQHFLVSHASGYLYVYNVDLTCSCSLPSYQLFKQGDCFAVHTCKTKTSRNPLYRWTICDGAVNEFQFSPDGRSLAVVSEDGYLRVFDYHTMELQGLMRSYFGGLLCVAWSPDAKYIATGGEDDLVSIYSVQDKRTVCRGQGHRSWVSKVAFDPYTSLVYCSGSIMHLDSDEDLRCAANNSTIGKCGGSLHDSTNGSRMVNRLERDSISSVSSLCSVTYRFGSVGHDTLLCLWDLSEDELKPPPLPQISRLRSSVLFNHSPMLNRYASSKMPPPTKPIVTAAMEKTVTKSNNQTKPPSSDHNFSTAAPTGRNKRLLINLTGGNSKNNEKSSSATNVTSGTTISQEAAANSALGSPLCPYLNDIPMIQPLISKKIAHERLSVIIFREDSIVTACQEGFICTWARPGHTAANLTSQHNLNSPCLGTSATMLPGATMV